MAARARSAGDKERAAVIKALKKPPAHLHALNRVARDHPAQVEAVLERARALRVAQQEGARAPDVLRESTRAFREAVQQVTALVPDAQVDRVRAVLQVVPSAGAEQWEAWRRGCVVAEFEAGDLGEVLGTLAPPPEPVLATVTEFVARNEAPKPDPRIRLLEHRARELADQEVVLRGQHERAQAEEQAAQDALARAERVLESARRVATEAAGRTGGVAGALAALREETAKVRAELDALRGTS